MCMCSLTLCSVCEYLINHVGMSKDRRARRGPARATVRRPPPWGLSGCAGARSALARAPRTPEAREAGRALFRYSIAVG